MHGLINRTIQNFISDNFGVAVWKQVARRVGMDDEEFEPMLTYEYRLTSDVIDAMSDVLGRPKSELLEDLGAYLVSNPSQEGVRRLLRFGGVGFEDFLYSLDDLHDRAKLAVPNLDLPVMEIDQVEQGHFTLVCRGPMPGFGNVMTGVLRVIADDYGALVLLDNSCSSDGCEKICIKLVDRDFAEGRGFELGAPVP